MGHDQQLQLFVALVMLDAVMPVLGGKQAYGQIMQIRSDVPVMFASGYAAEALPPRFLAEHNLKLLPKPFRPAALLAAVREALTGSA